MTDEWTGEEIPRTKSKRKSKGASAHPADEPIDETFDAMLDNASKMATTSKSKTTRRPPAEGIGNVGGGWSNEAEPQDENDPTTNVPGILPRAMMMRRPADEIVAADIPTIPMDDVDEDENRGDAAPQVAVAPEFSIHQIASFKEMENEFSRERASQYIDPKIDIGILYQNLHLQEDFNEEEQKIWDWDKLFVDIRNAITNPTND